MARGKVRKGRGGRVGEMPVTPRRKAPAGKVIYCYRCGSVGDHRTVREVGLCHDGIFVREGVHWKWVNG